MASNKKPIAGSWMDIVRLAIGGPEYIEGRLPDLFADIIAARESSDVLAGAISGWMRNSLKDENTIAFLYAVARWLKQRGVAGRVASEAIEMTLRTAHELVEYPAGTLAGATPEERRAYADAFATRFTQNFEAIKARLPTINTNGGPVADTNNPDPGPSRWDQFTAYVGGINESAASLVARFGKVAKDVIRYSGQVIGFSVLYCLAILMTAMFLPQIMEVVSWIMFVLLVGIPASKMFMAGREEDGAIDVLKWQFFLFYIASSLLFITFALAQADGIYLEKSSWRILLTLPIIAVVWDRVVLGITQNIMKSGKFAALYAEAFSSGATVDPTEKASIKAALKDSVGLVRISITVVAAVLVIWTFFIPMQMRISPIRFELFVLLMTVHILLTVAYARMALGLWRDGDWPIHLKEIAQGWSKYFLNSAQRAWVGATLIGLVLIVGFSLLSPKSNANNGNGGIATRIGTVAEQGVDRVLDKTEEVVRKDESKVKKETVQLRKSPARASEPKMNCGGRMIATSKVEARKKALGGVAIKGTEDGYPWNCR